MRSMRWKCSGSRLALVARRRAVAVGAVAARGLALVALIALAGTACTTATEPTLGEDVAGIPEGARPLAAREVFSTPHSGIGESERLVIRTREEWEAFWEQANGILVPQPEPPAIDFSKEIVLAAAMGQRPTGGYAISIREVRGEGSELFAVVVEVSPGAGCVTTQALTAPVAAVAVPRADGPVSFVERDEVLRCE